MTADRRLIKEGLAKTETIGLFEKQIYRWIFSGMTGL
jgi:hypothetical protein